MPMIDGKLVPSDEGFHSFVKIFKIDEINFVFTTKILQFPNILIMSNFKLREA